MLSNDSLKFELNLRKNITIFLRNSFTSKSVEENEGGLEVVGNLVQKQQVR